MNATNRKNNNMGKIVKLINVSAQNNNKFSMMMERGEPIMVE